jgi:predicted nucleic acid-binding protein
MTTVADASVIIALLNALSRDELLHKRLRRVVHAPALIDAEVLNAVRGMVLGGKITIARAFEMVKEFATMDNIIRYPAVPFLRRVLELRNNFTAYDALYVALAEHLRLPLLTRDAKYGRAAGHKADVQVYP